MNKTFARKPISILLALLMALSVFSATALAGGPSGNTGGELHTDTGGINNSSYDMETLELTQHDSGFNGNCFSVAPGSMTDLYDYTNSWDCDGDDSLSEMGVTISALYGEAIRKVVVYSRSHWNSFWNGTPVAVAGGTTLTYTRDGNTFTFENMDASSVIIGASAGKGIMITKIDVYYVETDHDVVKTVRLIDAIGTVAYTTACKQKIDAAKTAYDALSDAQKANVTNAQKLTDAIAEYNEYMLNAFKSYRMDKAMDFKMSLEEAVAGDSELEEALDQAQNAIAQVQFDQSKTMDENKAAVDAAVTAKTAEINDLIAAKALAAAKTAAKSALASYKSADAYRDAQKTELASAIEAGNTAIDAAADTAAVDTALAAAKTAIDAIKTDAQLTAAELAAAKTAAKSALASYKSADAYRDAQKTELASAIEAGNTAIDAAADTDAVETALAAAKTAIDAIKTAAELTAAELEAAKTAAKSALASYKSADAYRDAQKTELASAIEAGNNAIDAAVDTDAVETALAAAKTAIDAIKTDAELTAAELEAAKLAAKAELAAYKNPADYKEAQQAELAAAVAAGSRAIDAAADKAAVEAALSDAKAALDAIKTAAELTEPTDEPTNPTEPTEPTEEPTDEPTKTSGACELCGKTTHSPHWLGYLHAVIIFVRDLFTKVLPAAMKLK